MNAARAGASRGVEPLGSQRRGAWGRKRGRKTGGLLRRRLRGCGLHRRDENDHTNMPKVVVTDLEPEEPPAPVKKKVKLAASTAEPPSSQNAPKKKKMKKENEAAGDERLPESRKAGAVHEKKRKAGQKPAGTAQEVRSAHHLDSVYHPPGVANVRRVVYVESRQNRVFLETT